MPSFQLPAIAYAMRSHRVDQGDDVERRVTGAQGPAHAQRKRYIASRRSVLARGSRHRRQLVMTVTESIELHWRTFEGGHTANQVEEIQETNGCRSCQTNGACLDLRTLPAQTRSRSHDLQARHRHSRRAQPPSLLRSVEAPSISNSEIDTLVA